MKNLVKKFQKNTAGQTLTEYALILAVIAVAVIAVMTTMGDKVKETFQEVVDSL